MKLSKQEYKYRIKFIQEHHYNKSEQRQLDNAVIDLGLSYKTIYFNVRNGVYYMFMGLIGVGRVAKAMSKSLVSIAVLENSMKQISATMNEYREHEKKRVIEEKYGYVGEI